MQETAAPSISVNGDERGQNNSNKKVPWQMEWKHPQWITSQFATAANENDDGGDDEEEDVQVVGITSAMLSASEISKIFSHSNLESKQSRGADNHYLLTVSLLGNPTDAMATPNNNKDKSPTETKPQSSLASQVLLEVVDVPGSNPSDTKPISCKRLRWPESIFDANSAKTRTKVQRKVAKRKNLLEKVFLPLMGIDEGDEYGNQERRAQQFPKKQPRSTGIVAATLCRRPKDDELQLLAKTTATRDIVELMSFGSAALLVDSEPTVATDERSRKRAYSTENSNLVGVSSPPNSPGPRLSQEPEANTTTGELSFVCVSQAGEVFVYNPIHLLLGINDKDASATTTTTTNHDDDLENASNFFFGQDLFQNLQTTWKPLAEPSTRIHLSIFEHDQQAKQKKKKKKKTKTSIEVVPTKMVQSNQELSDMAQSVQSRDSLASSTQKEASAISDDASTIATSATDALTVVQTMAVEFQTNVEEGLSMLPYLLNPLLEPSTLKDRTIQNRPHSIAFSGSSHIVVTGSGVKTRHIETTPSWENASHAPTRASRERAQKPKEPESKAVEAKDQDSWKEKDAIKGDEVSGTKAAENVDWWEEEGREEKTDNLLNDGSKTDDGAQDDKVGTKKEENSDPLNNADVVTDEKVDESNEQVGDGEETKIEDTAAETEDVDFDSGAEPEDTTSDEALEKSPKRTVQNDEEENSQRHYFDGYKTAQPESEQQERGGFVTFLSTARWSEIRTLFLPFVPVRTSHIAQWNGMELLWVIGEFETLLIRMDSTGPVPCRIRDIFPLDSFHTVNMSNRTNSTSGRQELSPLSVKRFEILPIDLGDTASILSPRLLCASNTGIDPPSFLELHVDTDTSSVSKVETTAEIDRHQSTQALVLQKTLSHCTPQGTVMLRHAPSHVAKIMIDRNESKSIFAEHGQGWSLIGSKERINFVCWEGSTLLQGAYVEALNHSSELISLQALQSTQILPLSSTREASLETTSSDPYPKTIESPQQNRSSVISNLPFIDEFQPPLSPIPTRDRTRSDEIFSSPIPTRRRTRSDEIFSPKSKTTVFSRRENYEYLLQQCSSWTQLEDTLSNRIVLERQEPVLCIRGGKLGLPHRILSLRQLVVENGISSPFQQVLAWLAKRKNFFVAAGIALDLLKDGDTLYHLWQNAEMIDEEDEETKLFGLLDGISPVNLLDENQSLNEHKHSVTATHLSDMTVGCFIKGGATMAKTLDRFLEYNESYDPERVSLMLSLTTIELFANNPLKFQSPSASSDEEEIFDEILWPIKCLLSVGTKREYLHEVLSILNNTIPDELRHRRSEDEKEEEKAMAPSLPLTKKLIKLILQSDTQALELLMGFVDDQSGTTFWQSLYHPTRLALSLMDVNGSYPFLRHPDVRAWAREELRWCFQGKCDLPTTWLQDVSYACLQNASCALNDLQAIEDHDDLTLESAEAKTIDTTIEIDNPIQNMKFKIEKTRNALLPKKGYGIDFDMLIPALLLLEMRNIHWLSSSQLATLSTTEVPATVKKYVSTQSLLNAACHLAGRSPGSNSNRSRDDPLLFVGFDGKSAMKQCFQANNVVAGAYLIGGKNGFLLHVCDVLQKGIGMSIPDAESFLLRDALDLTLVKDSKTEFSLTEGHQQLLLLLEEHVLEIKTFGDFDFAHNRGKVDPVFCARSILRAWLSLSLADKAAASRWLGQWLEDRLGIPSTASSGDTPRSKTQNGKTGKEYPVPTKHRLACASLVRSLLWPNNAATPTTKMTTPAFSDESVVVDAVPLASTMEFEKKLLIELCQSCLGLVESVPPAVVQGIQI